MNILIIKKYLQTNKELLIFAGTTFASLNISAFFSLFFFSSGCDTEL